MDKIIYLLVISAILGSSLCVAQVTQPRPADTVPIPYSRSNYQGSIPSGSGTSNSENTQTVCKNGKCEQVITTCVNGLCTDKKSVTDGLGTSGQSSSQSKETRCVNGNCEEVTTTCTNGVCTESKSSNTIPNGFNSPIQPLDPYFDVPSYRLYSNPTDGFQQNFNDDFDQGIPNEAFGPIFNNRESRPTYNNDAFRPTYNYEEPRPTYSNEESSHYYNNEESRHYQNNGDFTPVFNDVQSRNQEQHTECFNGVCKTVTKVCNNGNCATTQ